MDHTAEQLGTSAHPVRSWLVPTCPSCAMRLAAAKVFARAGSGSIVSAVMAEAPIRGVGETVLRKPLYYTRTGVWLIRESMDEHCFRKCSQRVLSA